MSIPIPNVASIKKMIDFYKKFKGKRVKVYLRRENFTGILNAVVENPSGIILKDVSTSDEKDVEAVFVPLIAVTKIYVFKKANRAQE